jgi:hypothetical protein
VFSRRLTCQNELAAVDSWLPVDRDSGLDLFFSPISLRLLRNDAVFLISRSIGKTGSISAWFYRRISKNCNYSRWELAATNIAEEVF